MHDEKGSSWTANYRLNLGKLLDETSNSKSPQVCYCILALSWRPIFILSIRRRFRFFWCLTRMLRWRCKLYSQIFLYFLTMKLDLLVFVELMNIWQVYYLTKTFLQMRYNCVIFGSDYAQKFWRTAYDIYMHRFTDLKLFWLL